MDNKQITIGVLILSAVLLSYIALTHLPESQIKDRVRSGDVKPSPTPLPFENLTIPYLRKQTYQSTLGDREPYAQYGTYTSYLTSFMSDGLKINGLLTVPEGDMPEGGWPAVVFVHGYIPPAQYETTERYGDYVDYLARSGLVVFKIDLRGHGTSEGEAGGAYFSADYVIDTLNAYAALQNASFVNADRIGLWGHSMAGNVVMRAVAVRPDIPAVVIWAGAVYSYTDRITYGIQDNSYVRPPVSTFPRQNRQRLIDRVGEADEDNPFWQQMAPTSFLNDLTGAIQLNHAVDDQTVNIGYSRDLDTLLTGAGVPHEFHEYPGGGHNISGTHFIQAMRNTVTFYQKYLK